MTEDPRSGDAGASAEEVEAARRLAESMETGLRPSGEREVADVLRLFEALAAADRSDEVGLRKLRNELAADAGRGHRRSFRGIAAAVAVVAAGVLLAVLLLRLSGGPSARAVDERERQARDAFATASGPEASSRQAQLYDRQWRSRLDSVLEDRRFTMLSEQVSSFASDGATRPAQNPGGAS